MRQVDASRPAIDFIDQTVRDGPQSLWTAKTGMPWSMRARIVRRAAEVGYKVVDYGGPGWFRSAVTVGKDPWEELRRVAAIASPTVLRSGMRAQLDWELTPEGVRHLWIQRVVANGIGSFWHFDTLFDLQEMRERCAVAAAAGADSVMAIMYTLSPVHTDEYYAGIAREFATFEGATGIYIEDTAGVMLPDRISTLVTAVRGAAPQLPIELHLHDVNGLAELCYLNGVEAGASAVHTCVEVLSHGPSLPCGERTASNLVAAGYTVAIDRAALARESTLARQETMLRGLPGGGTPGHLDERTYEHQTPGGMMGSIRRHVREVGIADRLDDVLHEMSRVRVELGYPTMATPLSQFVGVQAVLNLMGPERYALLADETIQYVNGVWGQVPGPIDPDVMDRIQAHPRARQLRDFERPSTTVADLRRAHPGAGDDELLLRYLTREGSVDAMLAKRRREAAAAAEQGGLSSSRVSAALAYVRSMAEGVVEAGWDGGAYDLRPRPDGAH